MFDLNIILFYCLLYHFNSNIFSHFIHLLPLSNNLTFHSFILFILFILFIPHFFCLSHQTSQDEERDNGKNEDFKDHWLLKTDKNKNVNNSECWAAKALGN